MLGTHAKLITAVITAVIGWVTLVVNSPAADISSSEWVVLLASAATALGVYIVPNAAQSD